MKAWNITISTLALMFVWMGQVDAKPGNGKGGGKPGDDPPASTSCANKTSAFPAFAFTRLNMHKRGGVSSFEIHLSNADGDCSVMIYSASADEDDIDLSYRQNGSSGVIVWRQWRDEDAGRKDTQGVVKALHFQVSNKEITSSLPLSAETVGRAGEIMEFIALDLSHDGNTILLFHLDGITRADEGVAVQTIQEMDISNCASNCSLSLILTSSDIENFHNVSYSPSGNRIYFSGGFHFNSSDPRASQGYIAFIEKQSGTWSSRRYLTIEDNGYYGDDFSGSSTFRELDIALVDFRGSLIDAASYTFKNIVTGQFDVHIINVGSCSIGGTGDCLGTGESFFEASIADAQFPSFDKVSDANSLLFSAFSSDDIYDYELGSGSLSIRANGHQADSAD